MQILIIEDDPGIAFLMREALEDENRKIEIVHTGAEAMDFIKSHAADLMILDYSLPDTNARELIENLQQQNVSFPPFIVSTGQGDEMIAVDMMKLGALDYLVKDASLMRRLPGVVNWTINNIRQKKKLEEALESKRISDEKLLEEQRRLANIIKATNVGTWEWNLVTDQVIFNERYANIKGYTLQELMPATSAIWHDLTHPGDNALALQKLDDHLNKKVDYFEVEVRSKHKKGHWIWVLSRGCVMEYDEQGRPLMMAGTMQDISDKKNKEELLKQVEIANQTLAFKQSFLATMSHEMRTPLTGILGVSELLEKTSLDGEQRDFVEILQKASENLKMMIDQVLDYSNIEAGKVKLSATEVETRSFITQAKELFEEICLKPITFSAFFDESLPQQIIADRHRIMHVISSLLHNAVKYSDDGEITLKMKKNTDPQNGKLTIRVEVADTGMGIQPEKREGVFLPFASVNQIDTSKYEGTGLGLAICKEYVKMHGGDIGFESEPGKGSCFWFTFQASTLDSNSSNRHSTDGNAGKLSPELPGLSILLVEDKVITQKVIRLQLEDMGHKVTLAQNGREALELYQPDQYDVVLMDIQMPVMDGITATREMRKKHANLPPVIGLSANAFEGDREKYINMGFDEYITKPMNRDHFVEVVSQFFPSSKDH